MNRQTLEDSSLAGAEARPGVLIISASVGAGHNQAARALRESLAAAAPHLDVTVIDSLDFTSRLFRAKYAGGYALAVSRFPRLYGLGYALTDRPSGPGRSILERRRLWFESRALRRLGQYVSQTRPRLIVHTHFLTAAALQRMFRRPGRELRQVVVVTDVQPHRWWYCPGMEHWFAGYQPGAERLMSYGIEPGRITVSGIPVHPKWSATLPDRRAILDEWSLPAGRKIVLLSGGVEFTCGPVVRIARRLAAACPRACLVVLGGRNKKLLGRLAALGETRDGRIVPLGYTDRLHELAEVAGLIITKAGGLITAECLAKSRPMVFLKSVPGQERNNAEFFASEGAAVVTRNTTQLVQAVRRLLDSPAELESLAANASRLYRGGAETIVEFIRRAVE